MKKLLIMPLLVGLFSACFALSEDSVPQLPLVEQSGESQHTLEDIFQAAIPLFEAQYGTEVSLSGLQNGYENGTVVISEIDDETWEVIVDGNPLIVDSEDFL